MFYGFYKILTNIVYKIEWIERAIAKSERRHDKHNIILERRHYRTWQCKMFLYKSITLPARGNHKNNFMVAVWYCFRYKTQYIVKKRQGGTQTLYNILELIEAQSGENESKIICSHKHSSCLKVDLKDITKSKEDVAR